MRLATMLFLVLAPAAGAQTLNPVAYPQDTTTGSSGNMIPLGFWSTHGNYDEGRYQILIPATHLPTTGGVLLGIAVNSQLYTGPVVYTTLNINLGLTTATTLSTNFGANLSGPIPALAGTNLTVNYAARQWSPILFRLPVPYNGSDNIIVEFQKVYDRVTNPVNGIVTMETSGNPGRTDLPGRWPAGALRARAWPSARRLRSPMPLP